VGVGCNTSPYSPWALIELVSDGIGLPRSLLQSQASGYCITYALCISWY